MPSDFLYLLWLVPYLWVGMGFYITAASMVPPENRTTGRGVGLVAFSALWPVPLTLAFGGGLALLLRAVVTAWREYEGKL